MPRPVGHFIVPFGGQLRRYGSIRGNGVELVVIRRSRFKYDVPVVGCPARKVISLFIMGQLHILLATEIPNVNVGGTTVLTPALADPGEGQREAVGRPGGADGV